LGLVGAMSKYDSLKRWTKVQARVSHHCQKCEELVNKGEFYYKEKIDFVNSSPGICLGELCERCGEEAKVV